MTVKAHQGYRSAVHHARARKTARLTSSDRFRVRGALPAHGTIRVSNVSDTLHFMAIQRVKRGTTDKDIQKIFNSGGNGQGAVPAESHDGR